MKLDIKNFVISYLATASWVTCDSGENQEFTKQAKDVAKEDCLKFIEAVKKEFGEEKAEQLLNIQGNDLTHLAPHDFFLARNGHGTDFRDKDSLYGEKEAEKLVKIAQKIGGTDCYHIRGPKSKLCFD